MSLVKSPIDLPAEILYQLVQTQNEYIRKEIVKNKNMPTMILEVLKNPATPADILAEYIPKITNEKQIESILRGTGYTQQKNPHMPSEILEQLSHHPKDVIRYLVALYPNTPVKTLERLAFDSYDLVKATVAEKPHTPPNILIEMAKAPQN